jgi:hypothetical protein
MSDEAPAVAPSHLEQLQAAEKALREMYLLEKINRQVYSKHLLALAHDYIVLGEVVNACRLIEAVTHTYIEDQLPAQITADPSFGDLLFALAEKLVESGVVDLTPVYFCSGPPAKA